MLSSLRHSTKKQYLPYIEEFRRQEGNLTDITPSKLIRYLTSLYDNGLSYSTINTARSAISTISSLLSNTCTQIGSHPLVSRFMKGVHNKRPALPRYSHTWDPDAVLIKLEQVEYDVKSLTMFTKKVAFLLTLLAGQRVSTIGNLKVEDIHLGTEKVTILVTDLVKQTKPGNHQRPLSFHRFTARPNLCMYSLLSKYIEITRPLRSGTGDTANLFITTVPPHHNARLNTISNWIRSVLQDNGLNNYGPHSLRSAATSKWSRAAAPVDDIMRAAGWKRESTFRRFYNRPLEKETKLDHIILTEENK